MIEALFNQPNFSGGQKKALDAVVLRGQAIANNHREFGDAGLQARGSGAHI
jgi:hypothetical protein